MQVTRKIFTQAAANIFLSIFQRYSFFFFSFFCFFVFLFFFIAFLLFEIKNICSDTNSIMLAGEKLKLFHPADFRKQDYFFWTKHVICSGKERLLSCAWNVFWYMIFVFVYTSLYMGLSRSGFCWNHLLNRFRHIIL